MMGHFLDGDLGTITVDGIVGRSSHIHQLVKSIAKVAQVDRPVLVLGETGTGKELVAHSIRQHSTRRRHALVDVNCSAIPASLFEAELFGYERGAFTDAHQTTPGRFEQANGGILFLDEIGDLAIESQAKLLRVIETKQVRRLGNGRPIPIDVRIIAATNVDLDVAIRQGTFRADLYWRLNALSIHLAPLRQRRDDIPVLIEHFLPDLREVVGGGASRFSEEAVAICLEHAWPGNVRELQQVVCRAVMSSSGDVVVATDLPQTIRRSKRQSIGLGESTARPKGLSLGEALDSVRVHLERAWIEEAIQTTGSLALAAKSLGIDPRTLYQKRLRYQLDGHESASSLRASHKCDPDQITR
jgi:transcriptional regulator with PAS, ATPase and Fis domain